MPELAEVAYHCSRWKAGMGGRIEEVVAHTATRCFRGMDPKSPKALLMGRTLKGSRTHGKRMLFQFSDKVWLGLHLGMTGKLLIRDEEESLEKHDHLALRTRIGWLAFNDPRQFGKVELFQSESLPQTWQSLPLEILSPQYDHRYFETILQKRGRGVLKSLLLMQELFPGVGNWMGDEILWRARLRPDRTLDSLSGDERLALFKALKFVCRGAMKYIAPDYSDPPASWLFRHRWKPGGHCPRTGLELERMTVGGRTTCWSPQWQR